MGEKGKGKKKKRMNGGTSAYALDSLYYDSFFLSAVLLFVHACQPLTKHSLLLTMSQCTDSRREAERKKGEIKKKRQK